MKDITKQNFRYCLADNQGRGCLCAAMFHLKCGDDGNLLLNFKAEDTSYGNKTRNAWLVGYPDSYEMGGFYKMHRATFEFLENNFPGEDWYLHYYDYDDENMTCHAHDIANRSFPDQYSSEFWEMQFEISKKMWDKGYINGNYPQGHYMMNNGKLVLAVSYFAAPPGRLLTDQEVSAFNSCHKIQKENKKKNWFIKNYVRNKDQCAKTTSDDFWRLSAASQLYTLTPAFDIYLKKVLEMMGASSRSDINDFVAACLSKNLKDFEVDFEEFNTTLNDQSLVSS